MRSCEFLAQKLIIRCLKLQITAISRTSAQKGRGPKRSQAEQHRRTTHDEDDDDDGAGAAPPASGPVPTHAARIITDGLLWQIEPFWRAPPFAAQLLSVLNSDHLTVIIATLWHILSAAKRESSGRQS